MIRDEQMRSHTNEAKWEKKASTVTLASKVWACLPISSEVFVTLALR